MTEAHEQRHREERSVEITPPATAAPDTLQTKQQRLQGLFYLR